MNDTIVPLGKKFFRLGKSEYTNKKGTKVVQYGLEEVRAVPDGSGGITYEGAYQGTRLLCESPDAFRTFLLAVGNALPAKNGGVRKTVDVAPLQA